MIPRSTLPQYFPIATDNLSYSHAYFTVRKMLKPVVACHQQECFRASGGARVFAAPIPPIRSPTDILMITTMALVWTVNSTLS